MYKNKELRQKILSDGTFDDIRTARSNLFRTQSDYLLAQSFLFQYVLFKYGEDVLDESERIHNSIKKQRKRCFSHLNFMFKEYDLNCICFATFTIDDKYLLDPNFDILNCRRRIAFMLNRCEDYALNVDYGAKNGRVHFHAVIVLNSPSMYQVSKNNWHSFELDSYKFGFYYLEPIQKKEDSKRVANYLNKLVNHSLKIANQRISYKKNSKYSYWLKHCKLFFDVNI